MPGLAELALAGAPIAGGALLGLIAGNVRGPDVRAQIAADLDLLDRLPPEQSERRAALQRAIDVRIDDLVAGVHGARELRARAAAYAGNWRDILVFVCAVLFTLVWWNVSHSRSNWTVMFVVLIALCVLAGGYAVRGLMRAARTRFRRGG